MLLGMRKNIQKDKILNIVAPGNQYFQKLD